MTLQESYLKIDQERKLFPDVAKAFAIFLVTTFHVWRFIGYPSASWHGLNCWGLFKNGFMGCDLFFIVSAFLSLRSWEKSKGSTFKNRVRLFYKSKILRIIPAYYFALIFWYVLVSHNIAPKPYGLIDVLTHLFFAHTLRADTFFSTSGVFWYLGVQIHFYILFPFLALLWEKRNHLLLFVLSFLPMALYWVHFGRTENMVAGWNVLTFMPSFICGFLLYQKRLIFSNKLLLLPIAAIGCGIIFVDEISFFAGPFSRILGGMAMGILLFNAEPWLLKLPAGIKEKVTSVSVASFSIYLYNYVIYAWQPNLKLSLGLAVYTMLTFGFGFVMYALVEKPAQIFFKTVLSTRK